MSDTRYSLGTQELAYCKFSWPFYRGCVPRVVVIPQPAALADKFKALPYINTLRIEHSYGTGRLPVAGVIEIPGVRLLEVRELNEDVCELHLSDPRADLAKIVNPVAINLRFADGFLDGTRFKTLAAFLRAVADAEPAFAALLGADAESIASAFDAMPEGLPVGGPMLPFVLDRLAEDLGCDFTVADGAITLGTRADIGEPGAVPPVNSYLWLKGGSPSWIGVTRNQKGLPRKIRVRYRERHARRIALKSRLDGSAVGRNVLLFGLEQVYLAGGKYLTLSELLTTYGFASTDITDAQIASCVMSKNFEFTRLERLNGAATDVDTETVIFTIKRDWRRLWRMVPIDSAGRRGTWTDEQFGKFNRDADLDGSTEPSGKVDASALESKWVEFLNVAATETRGDQLTLNEAIVGTSHTEAPSGQSLPSAPFAVGWEPGGEADGIIRFTQQVLPDNNEAMPGELDTLDGTGKLRVGFSSGGVFKRDDGSGIPTDWNLQWPAKENAAFKTTLELYVYMVAERQLPNTAERWTNIEFDGFADGDVEFADLEVGSELFALYDYVDEAQGKNVERDSALGLGRLLNDLALYLDAEKRVKRYKQLIASQIAGAGRSLGVVLANDVRCTGAVSEVRIEVDGVNVSTVIECGNLGNAEARERIQQRREAQRPVTHGGKVAV